MSEKKRWWQSDTQEVCRVFHADCSHGLSLNEAKKRLEEYGPNQLPETKRVSALVIFGKQFWNFVVITLLVAILMRRYLANGLTQFQLL